MSGEKYLELASVAGVDGIRYRQIVLLRQGFCIKLKILRKVSPCTMLFLPSKDAHIRGLDDGLVF